MLLWLIKTHTMQVGHSHLVSEQTTNVNKSNKHRNGSTNYLTNKPEYVRLKDCTLEVLVCSTWALPWTVLSPFLFSLYTTDFRHNSEQCHLQKFSDDTAIVGCVSEGKSRNTVSTHRPSGLSMEETKHTQTQTQNLVPTTYHYYTILL